MARKAAAVVAILLLFSSADAEGAPARTSVSISISPSDIATAINSANHDPSTLLLDVVRTLFDAPDVPAAANAALRARLQELLRAGRDNGTTAVPLPLTPDIWRNAILQAPVPDEDLVAAILERRETALLYYGLSALDDETLEWLAREPDVLSHLQKFPGTVAAFGRSLRVRNGQIALPGGDRYAPAWRDVVGADPRDAAPFTRALFRSHRGRIAMLYDSVLHLDANRQQFALNGGLGALADIARGFAQDWNVEARPFVRPLLDPWLLLSTVRVDAQGTLAGPSRRDIWERVFRDDDGFDVTFKEVAAWNAPASERSIDAAWLASRINLAPLPTARRRLETFLFAQRVLGDAPADPRVVATVLRAHLAMPALMLTLERIGVRETTTLMQAARHARAVHEIPDNDLRHTGIALFQAAIAFIERGTRARALSASAGRTLIDSLAAIPVDRGNGYAARVAAWLRRDLFNAAPQPAAVSTDPIEEAILALLAGHRVDRPAPIVEWEGGRYRADPAAAELLRLRRVRERQGGPSIDSALAQLLEVNRKPARRQPQPHHAFRGAVVSVLYAAYLGDPEGPTLAAGNVALRHHFGFVSARPGVEPMSMWRLPLERFGGENGWRVEGSLLGLDVAFRRLALRRMDSEQLPPSPLLPVNEGHTAMLTAALMNPYALTDASLNALAAAVARGRRLVSSLNGNSALVDEIAGRAGFSEWRREALRWKVTHAPARVADAFSLAELFWLGAEGGEWHEWGAAALPLTGCVCLETPRAVPWEQFVGRYAAGLLSHLGIDVTLRVAEALAARKLPAVLAPAVIAYAMRDVIDETRWAHSGDWPAFGSRAKAIDDVRLDDYIAALTANGPLLLVRPGTA